MKFLYQILLILSLISLTICGVNSDYHNKKFLLRNKATQRYLIPGDTKLAIDRVGEDSKFVFRFQSLHNSSPQIKITNVGTGNSCSKKPSSDSFVTLDCKQQITLKYGTKNGDIYQLGIQSMEGHVMGMLPSQGNTPLFIGNEYDVSGIDGNYFIWELILVDGCSNGQVYRSIDDITCTSNCGNGYGQGEYFCVQCQDNCDKCEGISSDYKCTDCSTNKYFMGDQCVSNTWNNDLVSIKSNKGNDYCSNRGSRVECDHGSVKGDWEKFKVSQNSAGYIYLKSQKNQKYCRQNGNDFDCDTSSLGHASQWRFMKQSDGKIALQNRNSGDYVRTEQKKKKVMWWKEHNYYYLKVDRDDVGSHEKYTIAQL